MFHGSLVALVTPLTQQGEVDYHALTALVGFHLDNQTDGIVVVGTTGECATLTGPEKAKVIRHVVEQVGGRIPVIAGTGATSTRQSIDSTRQAMELGVDGCLIMAPPYIKPTQEGLYQHYRSIAEAVPIPIILYNVPGRTACDIRVETVGRLATLPNIVAIKEATGDPLRSKTLVEKWGQQLDVLSGDDNVTAEILQVGGKGVISVTANVVPKLVHELCVAGLEGNEVQLQKLAQHLTKLNQALFLESNPIPVKWAVAELGLCGSGLRLPMTSLSENYHQQLQQTLKEVGALA